MLTDLLFGVLGLSFWGYVVATLVFTHITILGVTIYLHRHQTHRALELHPVVSHIFRLWLWMSTGMVTGEWVAIHRKHHAKVETEEDPHSPKIVGLRKVLFDGVDLYRKESRNKETMEKYSHGTPNDWIENKVYRAHTAKGIFLMMAIDLLLFGVPGITIWAIQMMWIPFFAAGVVNGVGHFWGYRNFESQDTSTNIIPWGIIIGGEELHNNHHAYASSAKFSMKWWEFDMGWMYIRLLSFFRLAKVKKLPSVLLEDPNKSSIDIETVKALLHNRLQVMARYSKEVVAPVFKEERRQAGVERKALFQRGKRLLRSDETFLSAQAKDNLQALLQDNAAIASVHQYGKRLQNIWNQATTNPKELVEQVQNWCAQAEASGIESLRDFSRKVSGFEHKAAAVS